MGELLANWPLVMAAQLLGVLLAWGADAVSWKLRQDDEKLFAFNLVSSFVAVPLLYLLVPSSLFYPTLFALLFWMLWVVATQVRQYKSPLRDTFCGVVAQLICFLAVFVGGFLLIIPFYPASTPPTSLSPSLKFDAFAMIYFSSATLIYALLSLFRPTIRGTWQMWRQSFSKQSAGWNDVMERRVNLSL